ncbi:hypothetical protein GCM10027597_63070 [Saccharopolyspora tripterygii]
MFVSSSIAADPSPGRTVTGIAIDTVTSVHDARDPLLGCGRFSVVTESAAINGGDSTDAGRC